MYSDVKYKSRSRHATQLLKDHLLFVPTGSRQLLAASADKCCLMCKSIHSPACGACMPKAQLIALRSAVTVPHPPALQASVQLAYHDSCQVQYHSHRNQNCYLLCQSMAEQSTLFCHLKEVHPQGQGTQHIWISCITVMQKLLPSL